MESKADCIREMITVKESLKRSTTSEIVLTRSADCQRVCCGKTQSIVEAVLVPIDVKVIEPLSESPVVVDPVVTNVPRRARTTKGCVLVDFGYKAIPLCKGRPKSSERVLCHIGKEWNEVHRLG